MTISRLIYRIEPLMDLYLGLLKRAEENDIKSEWGPPVEALRLAATSLADLRVTLPGRPDLEPAIKARRKAGAPLTDLEIGLIKVRMLVNGLVYESRTIGEFEALLERLGSEVGPLGQLRPSTRGQLAEAMRLGYQAYAGGNDQSKSILEKSHKYIQTILDPREEECLTFLLSGLQIPDPGFEVPIFLVVDAPDPGAFSARGSRGEVFCCVAVGRLKGTTLLETLLHEATHCLEAAAGSPDHSVLGQIRSGLMDRGIDSKKPVYRDLPHTVLFVHAAESTRRIIDQSHIDYGDSHGYYAKVPGVAEVVRSKWVQHLNGKMTAIDAIQEMIAEATAGSWSA